MLEKSFGLFFFLKQPKNPCDEKYIYARITVDGVSKEISTKRSWPSSRWDSRTGLPKGTKEDALTLATYLVTFKTKIYAAHSSLVRDDKEITADAIKDLLTGKGQAKRMTLEIFQYHNDQMAALVGKEYAPATLQRYKTALDHTRSFIQWKYAVNDLELKGLDYEFISEYSFWLKSIRKCGHNATVKYLGNFKKIILECVRKGWLLRDPFAGFNLNRKEVIRTALTNEEIKNIEGKDFCTERLRHVRDIFMFSCYTGLAYVDVKNLKRSQVIKGIDDEQWIITSRQKTETPTRLPLLPAALEIVERYKNDSKCIKENRVLPVLTNQKMNEYLKEIATLCNVKKTLTFHIARHTFATTITLSNGVPLETVSKMLGHKSIKQTQHYAKIVDLKISQDMAALKQKLSAV